jgi:two-component system response regulator PilR (NtrC family)/two-component system KDP operon response regulator KdpE
MTMADLDPYLLIVDDQPEICKLLASCFKDEGFIARMALSGEQAIRAICIQTPALIFMGFRMAGMNGLETLKKVQGLIYDVPVIMISAGMDGDEIAELLRAGRSRYFLPKPFSIASLKQLVKEILTSPPRALTIAN